MGLSDVNLTVQSIIFRILALLIIAGVQGGLIASAAFILGDKGPKYDGRLTLSPTSHMDLAGTIGTVVFGLGWIKPVDIDVERLRLGAIGPVIVVAAGAAGLLAVAVMLSSLILPALTTLPQTAGLVTAAFLRGASSLAIWIALLSLVPVPPLSGGLLLGAFGIRVPRPVQGALAILLLVAVATGWVRSILAPAHAVLASALLGG